MKRILVLSVILCIILACFALPVSALTIDEYEAYTYSNEQKIIVSPETYSHVLTLNFGMGGLPKNAEIADIQVYKDQLFILEKSQGRIYVVNSDGTVQNVIGNNLELNAPEGFFISQSGYIYIADTANKRIVKSDTKGKLLATVGEPDQKKTLSQVEFFPSKIVVDRGERCYVIVNNETNGIYQLDMNGNFLGFFGSVPVIPSLKELFWRSLSTKEQLSRMLLFVPTEYSSMDIDGNGFIYTTVATNTDSEMQEYIKSKGSNSNLAPIRKLNPKNIDVLIRNGSMPPAGDLIESTDKIDSGNASRFVDISVQDTGIYCALDSTKNRIFIYDEAGNLLCVFGNNNEKNGGLKKPISVAWWNDRIAVADSENSCIKVYAPTDFAKLIYQAVDAEQVGNYEESSKYWNKILEKHPGNDLAYVGLGKKELRNGNYKAAMSWFKRANRTNEYSKAMKLYRNALGKKLLVIIVAVIIAAAILIWIGKRQYHKYRKTHPGDKAEHPLWEGFKYGFYIMRHPFDGFWDMQFEQRGRLSSATLILGLTVLFNLIATFFNGYLVSGTHGADFNVLLQGVLSVVAPFGLWCVANWSVTSLMNGSGNFKYIYMYSCYSLTPLLISMPLLVVLSNIITQDEIALYTIIQSLFFIWLGFLLFVGTLVVHQYNGVMTVATILIIIVAIGIILFLALLCTAVVQQMTDFIGLLIEEINLRI